jgi:GTP 3',8-cyclase
MQGLFDDYHRRLRYLRISITDRCNLRCRYCAPLMPTALSPHRDVLRYEEILRVVRIGVKLGIRKVRVTGGEPLVRRGVDGFLQRLTAIPGLADVSLTTNGVLLKDHLDPLRAAGIQRINVSLDSLDGDGFQRITGRDRFEAVWEGIHLALEKGFDPVKINVVVQRGINDHELSSFAELSIRYPFHIRFIEYMPIGPADLEGERRLLTPEIRRIIASLGELIPVQGGDNDGPALRFRFPNARGEIGFISPISHHFCSHCDRLRLTADGQLRSCLLSDQAVDMRAALRGNASDAHIAEIFRCAARNKQREHSVGRGTRTVAACMSAIGG